MKNRSLISITDFSKEEQMQILSLAAEFEKNPDTAGCSDARSWGIIMQRSKRKPGPKPIWTGRQEV